MAWLVAGTTDQHWDAGYPAADQSYHKPGAGRPSSMAGDLLGHVYPLKLAKTQLKIIEIQ